MFNTLSIIVIALLSIHVIFHYISKTIYIVKSGVKDMDNKKDNFDLKDKILSIPSFVFILDIVVVITIHSYLHTLFAPITNLSINFDNFTDFFYSVYNALGIINYYIKFDYNSWAISFILLSAVLTSITIYYIVSIILQIVRKEIVSKYQILSVISIVIILYGLIYLGTHINNIYNESVELASFLADTSISLEDKLTLETIKDSRDYYNLLMSTSSVLNYFYSIVKFALVLRLTSYIIGFIELYQISSRSIKLRKF